MKITCLKCIHALLMLAGLCVVAIASTQEERDGNLIEHARLGNLYEVRILLQGDVDGNNKANVNATEKHRYTALHFACDFGHTEVVEELLKWNPDVNAVNVMGLTALYMGCEKGFIEIIRQLLIKGADPTISNPYGDTPLHAASSYNRTEVASLLIGARASINARNKLQENPVDIAIRCGFAGLCDLLVLNGGKASTIVQVARHSMFND